MSGISGKVFMDMLTRQEDTEAIEQGLRAAVRAYYNDNTDAVEVDYHFFQALRAINDLNYIHIDDLIAEEEWNIHQWTGRKFDSQLRDVDG